MVMTLFGRNMDINAPGRKYRGQLQRLSWKELLLLRLTVWVRAERGQMWLTHHGQYEWVIAMRELFTGIKNFRDHMRAEPDILDAAAGI